MATTAHRPNEITGEPKQQPSNGTSLLQPTLLLLALIGAMAGFAAAQPSAQPEAVSADDYHYQEVYDNLVIASLRLRSGGFAAYVFVDDETRAVYELSVRDRTGSWRILKDDLTNGGPPTQAIVFDYQQARGQGLRG